MREGHFRPEARATVHLAWAREGAEHCSQPADQRSLKFATTAYASASHALRPLPLATILMQDCPACPCESEGEAFDSDVTALSGHTKLRASRARRTSQKAVDSKFELAQQSNTQTMSHCHGLEFRQSADHSVQAASALGPSPCIALWFAEQAMALACCLEALGRP